MQEDDPVVAGKRRRGMGSDGQGLFSALRARFKQGTSRDQLGQVPAFRRLIGRILAFLLFFGLWRVLDVSFVLPWFASAAISAIITGLIVKIIRSVWRMDQL